MPTEDFTDVALPTADHDDNEDHDEQDDHGDHDEQSKNLMRTLIYKIGVKMWWMNERTRRF